VALGSKALSGTVWGLIQALGTILVSKGLLFTSLAGDLGLVKVICVGLPDWKVNTGLGSWRLSGAAGVFA
jgi:hypothetical protein